MAITRQRLTLEEFLARPDIDEKPYLEHEDGEVTQKEPSGGPHSVFKSLLPSCSTARPGHASSPSP
jgi:Uma2 family endonuclease